MSICPLAHVATRLLRPLALLGAAFVAAAPASAAVTITFWSHELGNSFPHAFITMRGVPDGGGAPVDMNIGFTAKHISPAILFGTVAGQLEAADIGYLKGSDAHFSVTMTDAQYVDMLRLLEEWGPGGNQRYNMNKRNCVTFVKVAAERLHLQGTEQPGLMKRPRSYLVAVESANAGHVTAVDLHGGKYVATLAPVPGLDPAKPVLTATGAIAPALALTNAGPVAAPTAVITAKSMDTGKAAHTEVKAEETVPAGVPPPAAPGAAVLPTKATAPAH